MCSGKWSLEKYVLDDSLKVTRIRGRREVKYEMKKCGPPYTCLGPLDLPTHKKLAPPLLSIACSAHRTCIENGKRSSIGLNKLNRLLIINEHFEFAIVTKSYNQPVMWQNLYISMRVMQ